MKLIDLEELNYEVFFEDGESRNYISEEALNKRPVIDAEPVKRGAWVDGSKVYKYVEPDYISVFKCCLNCGRKEAIARFKIVEWEHWHKYHWDPKLSVYCRDCGSKNIN